MSAGREKEFDQYARECVRLAKGVNDPESDAASADVSEITLKFATTGAV